MADLSVPCTASYLEAKGVDLSTVKEYVKYKIKDSDVYVYHKDSVDVEIERERAQLLQLKKENEQILNDLGLSSRQQAEAEMKQHMERLHEYNKVKDATQALIGRLAEMRSTTCKELYAEFGLDLDD